jgi:hypothetical protein
LEPVKRKEIWTTSGVIDVIDDEGGYWDSYNVAIILPAAYPHDLPIPVETSRKILRNIDWHVSENGICCLSTPSLMFHELSEDINLQKWLDKFAHPFLANHVYRKKTTHYAHEEFSHGPEGIIEGWKKILKMDNAAKVLEYLQYMAGNKTVSLNKPCFCGSEKKYKRCYVKSSETSIKCSVK